MSDASSTVTYTSPVAPPSPDYVPGPKYPPSPDYPSNGNEDDTDDEDPDEEPFEENDEEEEEHPALADSPMVPTVDLALSAREAEALEPDEPIHAPGSAISILLSQTRLCRARKTVRPEPPISPHITISLSQIRLRRTRKTVRPKPSMSASMEACIARHAALLSPPLPVPSPPLPLP
nr:hypothetical protein [Tanacetum cinerariifolium]